MTTQVAFGKNESVPKDIVTTILTSTNSTGAELYLRSALFKANARSKVQIFINNVLKVSRRLTTPNPSYPFDLLDLTLFDGDVLVVKAIHGEPCVANISASIDYSDIRDQIPFQLQLNGIVTNDDRIDGVVTDIESINGIISLSKNISGKVITQGNISGTVENDINITGMVICK